MTDHTDNLPPLYGFDRTELNVLADALEAIGTLFTAEAVEFIRAALSAPVGDEVTTPGAMPIEVGAIFRKFADDVMAGRQVIFPIVWSEVRAALSPTAPQPAPAGKKRAARVHLVIDCHNAPGRVLAVFADAEAADLFLNVLDFPAERESRTLWHGQPMLPGYNP